MSRPDPIKKLKVDLHTHTADDPQDYIAFSSFELIDRASRLGFDALAITNHDIVTFGPDLEKYAGAKGILLLPGVELTLSHKHVLLINPASERDLTIRSLADLSHIKTDQNLVIAPHPYYPGFKCLWSRLEEYISSFDAVEFSFFYNHFIDRNKRAVRLAVAHGKPLLGSSDSHNLWQLGLTYTLVEAEKTAPSIIAAVKKGKTELVTTQLSLAAMARVALNFTLGDRLKVHLRI